MIFNRKSVKKQVSVRKYWVDSLVKIAHPVLYWGANDQLKEKMPISGLDLEKRKKYAYLEAVGRTVCGIAPWLENIESGDEKEKELKEYYADLSRRCISNIVNPKSKDFAVFDEGTQPLVDAAFLCQGILRGKTQIWDKLSLETKKNVIICMKQARKIKAWRNNWVLFSSMIEVFLQEMEKDVTGHSEELSTLIDYSISQFRQWYVGDGCYKDGVEYRFDYYNGIVIHPLLWDIVKRTSWVKQEQGTYLRRSQRYAEILERMIAPDGSYPIVGRSISYRGGIFHILSLLALDKELGKNLSPAQVRCALTETLHKFMSGNIFDDEGWLKIGIVNEQPDLGEDYINTGSLYLFCTMFLPLGLSEEEEFWNAEEELWTSKKIWGGCNNKADKAL